MYLDMTELFDWPRKQFDCGYYCQKHMYRPGFVDFILRTHVSDTDAKILQVWRTFQSNPLTTQVALLGISLACPRLVTCPQQQQQQLETQLSALTSAHEILFSK